jgi:hypothetical protein
MQPHAAEAPLLRAKGEALENTLGELKSKYETVVAEQRARIRELEEQVRSCAALVFLPWSLYCKRWGVHKACTCTHAHSHSASTVRGVADPSY